MEDSDSYIATIDELIEDENKVVSAGYSVFSLHSAQWYM